MSNGLIDVAWFFATRQVKRPQIIEEAEKRNPALKVILNPFKFISNATRIIIFIIIIFIIMAVL